MSELPMAFSDEESKVADRNIDVQLSRVLSNAGFRFHEENNRNDMPVAAVAIELNGDELPDGFEFPPPPPMSPQGDDNQGHGYDLSDMRPVPRPPVMAQSRDENVPVGRVVRLSGPQDVDLNMI